MMAASAEKRPNLAQPRKSAKPEPPSKADRVEVRVSFSSQALSDIKKLGIKLFGQPEPQAVIRFATQELINQRLYAQQPTTEETP